MVISFSQILNRSFYHFFFGVKINGVNDSYVTCVLIDTSISISPFFFFFFVKGISILPFNINVISLKSLTVKLFIKKMKKKRRRKNLTLKTKITFFFIILIFWIFSIRKKLSTLMLTLILDADMNPSISNNTLDRQKTLTLTIK
jgi:hypothetical protein